MTTSVASLAPSQAVSLRAARPSFVGIVRGELFKVSRQRASWIFALLVAGIIVLPFLVVMSTASSGTGSTADLAKNAPLTFLYGEMGASLLVLRLFAGALLLLITARLIGMEYSGGTIRILLARGVGRLQLLGAKLTAVALIALALMVAGLLLDAVLTVLTLQVVAGSLDGLKTLGSGFWPDTLLYVGIALLGWAVSILMATAVTVVSRSLAIGLSVAISWFPADNIGMVFLYLGFRLTGNTFWTLVTGDLLGPNLNQMPVVMLPARAAFAVPEGVLPGPFVPVTGGHTLLVAAIYAVIFAAVSIFLTWRRDVLE
jgi:ABC-type transport system involved in multi-copper enzyme maturation permease subunit